MSYQTQQRRTETTFIETSGGLLTEQLIRKLRDDAPSEQAVAPETFNVADKEYRSHSELEKEISEHWEALKERWDTVSQNSEIFGMDTSTGREEWIIPLLDALGFEPAYQQQNLSADGITANLSHLGWPPKKQLGGGSFDEIPPVTHLVQPDKHEPLDSGSHRGTGASGRSPHDELQRFLNAADQQWSLATDGLKLRLLRDYYHTYTRGYVEFDLENIFTNRNYEDFRVLYRLCHISRFTPHEGDDGTTTRIEELYQVALATGIKIGQDLRGNVIRALEALGNGFLRTNPELREQLQGGNAELEDYYQDLLFHSSLAKPHNSVA